MPTKLRLAHLPTPLVRFDALDRLAGCEVWVKRDDASAGAEAGNKIRKLEYLLADALDRRATHVVTCGAAQSNHARATALSAASVGLRSVLLLRTADPARPPPDSGNLLVDRLVGAEVRFITPADYARRSELLAATAQELDARGGRAVVIPEGGSSGLGSLGYVDAMEELGEQLARGEGGGPAPFDVVVHACGSGGTAAGVALGVARYGVARRVVAAAVCDDRAYFEGVVARLVAEARSLRPDLPGPAELEIAEGSRGPAYGVPTAAQLALLGRVARETGLLFDPVYTGKALHALTELSPRPGRALLLHTGGLPGLLAHPDLLAPLLGGAE